MNNGEAILSQGDIQTTRENLNTFTTKLDDYTTTMNKVVELFSNQDIVQSLFVSGRFGQEQQQYLENLTKALNEFHQSMINDSDGVIRMSQQFLDNQEALLNKGRM